MDTFQLIAFLLSAFNIASIMVANANNNNNNNNINDNDNNINDNNINESNTNAEVMAMAMVGLGGRSLNGTRTLGKRGIRKRDNSWLLNLLSHRQKIETQSKSKQSTKSNDVDAANKEEGKKHMKEEMKNSLDDADEVAKNEIRKCVESLQQMVMKSHLAASFPCLEKVFCDSCEKASSHGALSWPITEVSSIVLSSNLPAVKKLNPGKRFQQTQKLVAAGKYGRLGMDCKLLYPDCDEREWNFINYANLFTWSTVGDLKSVDKLLSWAYTK